MLKLITSVFASHDLLASGTADAGYFTGLKSYKSLLESCFGSFLVFCLGPADWYKLGFDSGTFLSGMDVSHFLPTSLKYIFVEQDLEWPYKTRIFLCETVSTMKQFWN